jgi:hypothetical protein
MAKVSTNINLNSSHLGSGGSQSFTSTTTPAITPHNGKTNAFLVSGAFAGGTVKLQHKIGDNYVDIGPDTTLTANGGGLFTTPVSDLQVSVTGADGSPSFDVQVIIKPISL